MRAVLDASAILAFIRGEPGEEVVWRALRRGACATTANWCEVLSKLSDRGHDPDAMTRLFRRGPSLLRESLRLERVTPSMALEAARIRSETGRLDFSLGDRLCLALGRIRGAPVLTTDRAWRGLGVGVRVRLIR